MGLCSLVLSLKKVSRFFKNDLEVVLPNVAQISDGNVKQGIKIRTRCHIRKRKFFRVKEGISLSFGGQIRNFV